jgi:hypothetical protein
LFIFFDVRVCASERGKRLSALAFSSVEQNSSISSVIDKNFKNGNRIYKDCRTRSPCLANGSKQSGAVNRFANGRNVGTGTEDIFVLCRRPTYARNCSSSTVSSSLVISNISSIFAFDI